MWNLLALNLLEVILVLFCFRRSHRPKEGIFRFRLLLGFWKREFIGTRAS